MAFGKNKVQYYNFYWQFYRFDKFDCYFNEFGRDLAQFTAQYATKKLKELEGYFDYTLEKRMIFIIYNNSAEYKQTNIGLVTFDEESYNIGGFSRIIKNKVMLYYEGDHVAYQNQITASIAEVIINEMLYNAETRDRVSSSQEINMPDWYIKGLIKYTSQPWNTETENRVKDGFKSGKYKNINYLEYDDAIDAGMSFWKFIGKEYGDAIIPNILYLTKVYKNINDGFRYVTGKKLKELLADWKSHYAEQYANDLGRPDNNSETLITSRKDQIFQQVKVSPDGRYIAWVTNDWGKRRIWLYDNTTGKQKKIFRKEPKFEQFTDDTYPVIAWHPSSRILTFINEEKNSLVMYFYRVDERNTEIRNLLYYDKILDFSYSPDGTRLVMSAVQDGVTDIYLHTIVSGTNEQITRDIADDLHPSFMKNSPDEIIFSSNRLSDTLYNTSSPFDKLSPVFDLFTYNVSHRTQYLTRLSGDRYSDKFHAAGLSKNTISYISNSNGIMNRQVASFDSAISFIDTATHYRHFLKSYPVTNYDRNILNQSVSDGSGIFSETVFSKRKFMLRKGNFSDFAGRIPESEIFTSEARKDREKELHAADSIEQIRQRLILEYRMRQDTLTKPLYEYYATDEPINISHYIFEKEKENYYEQLWRKDYMDIDLDTGHIAFPLIRIYERSFYNNYLVGQVDFSFLNNSYQPYSGGAPYYNPGLNMLTRFGVVDLFENYRITGGVRFAGNFDSNEYLLSVENLMGKYDKQLTFHRQAFFSSNDTSVFKSFSSNLNLSYSKPITPTFALRGTVAYRNDRHVFLATDVLSLAWPDIVQHWGSLKAEAIYDNTRKRTVNIMFGTRAKIFGEYYRQINRSQSDMFVVGIDFRKYIRLHRELIWANRFAASTSFGSTKLLYYLGGVDNWMGYLFNSVTMFDNSTSVTPGQNYSFQALATNMRGFSQNVRNGNSFAVINSEIRWPVIRYIAGHPLKSNFLNSIQIIGFGDIGSAWTGISPWNSNNGYDNDIITNGPVKVTIDSNRQPLVAGFGFGARAQVFGYFVRADWAWGIESQYILPRIFYLSFGLDF
jgi:WD40 repeat protein